MNIIHLHKLNKKQKGELLSQYVPHPIPFPLQKKKKEMTARIFCPW